MKPKLNRKKVFLRNIWYGSKNNVAGYVIGYIAWIKM